MGIVGGDEMKLYMCYTRIIVYRRRRLVNVFLSPHTQLKIGEMKWKQA